MQLGALFLSGLAAGLVAGAASCTAVQGGLLVGVAGSRDPWLVAQFLAGRFLSYTLAGALLGAIGSAVQLPPAARALLLVAAGITVIAYSVRLMRRPVCRAARSRDLKAPLMGAATILIPCGVTVGTEMVAVSTGSALSGAAVMAGFVVGTAPALALLGYLLRRVSQTRLAALAGAVALAAGLWTVGSGLSLGGWLPSPTAPAAASTSARLTIWATRDGYRPGIVNAPAGVPVELVFKVAEDGCTRTVTIDGRDVRLPATVRLPPQRPGSLRYVCAMGMFSGFIRFS